MDQIDPRTRAILDGLTQHARPLILDHYRADSCIASTRVAIEVLRYFGLNAEPLPLLVLAFNAEAARMIEEGADLPTVHAETLKYSTDDPGGPWTIAVGTGRQARHSGDEGWAGHLVAAIPDLKVVIDLSIDQINRPHKTMNFTPVWSIVPEDDWWAGEVNNAFFRTDEDCLLILDRNALDPDGYKASTNWTMKDHSKTAIKQIVGQAIRQVRADLSTTTSR